MYKTRPTTTSMERTMAMQATAKVTWRAALLPSDCGVVDWGLLEGVLVVEGLGV